MGEAGGRAELKARTEERQAGMEGRPELEAGIEERQVGIECRRHRQEFPPPPSIFLSLSLSVNLPAPEREIYRAERSIPADSVLARMRGRFPASRPDSCSISHPH